MNKKEASQKDKKPKVITLRFYKWHILAVILVIFALIGGFSTYFKYYQVLPQSAINIMPEFPYSLQNQQILIISPHCDDETLGSAGLIQKAIKENSQIKVAITTDCNKHKIGETRKSESHDALKLLGVTDIDFLNFPEIDSGKEKGGDNLSLGESLDREIQNYSPTLIIAPNPDDTHADHRAAGEKTRELVTQKYQNIKIAYYLIHYNFLKYPSPSGLHPEDFLLPPARLISFGNKWYILPLSQDEENRKQDAVYKYPSQLKKTNPILHILLLDFVRKNELFMIEQ